MLFVVAVVVIANSGAVSSSHIAYIVIISSLIVVKFSICFSFSYTTLPVALVAHPLNVYPVFVNVFSLNFCATSYVNTCFAIVPFPLFASNTIVYVFAVLLAVAVNVRFSAGIIISVCFFVLSYSVPKLAIDVVSHPVYSYVYPCSDSIVAFISAVAPHFTSFVIVIGDVLSTSCSFSVDNFVSIMLFPPAIVNENLFLL